MKQKHILILFSIFFLLLSVLFFKKTLTKPDIETTEYKNLQLQAEPSSVYAIEIGKGGGKAVRLERSGKRWTIPSKWNINADKEKVEKFIGDITSIEGEMRSSSEKVLGDYGISDEEAFYVSLLGKSGGIIRRFFIGTKKPGYEGSFIRMAGSKEVYLADKDILPLIGIYGEPEEQMPEAEKWIDLSVTEFNADMVESITISRFDKGGETIRAALKRTFDEEKGKRRWKQASGEAVFTLDAGKISNFLAEMNNIRGIKAFDPNGGNYGFAKPFVKITLKTQEERPLEIEVGKEVNKNTGERYIKNSRGFVYSIRRYAANKLDIDMARFFIDNPLRVNDERINAVTVKSKDRSALIDKDELKENQPYIEALKAFSVKKIVPADEYPEGMKSPPDYSLKIEAADKNILVLDVEATQDGKYIGRIEGTTGLFQIDKKDFVKIFEEGVKNLKLAVPEGPEKPKPDSE